ncbi:nitrate reductase cytochrome c-type subunit [Hyunsoonleella sp. SJ7]|uniref:Nitrate reductase cytochrome c-type subunit n=1 Tax=Hyunsoonleella aquatilis TaxID=2762758 RepID=A0A923HJW4_9FLAO|nr:nitrate reductase cytochrome c-type subunit [Hyunsoonleella aquatilis]MBC3759647.1 nitrate reductase cytochrome c-type subunit [Hyunsoonleella aquatilis]
MKKRLGIISLFVLLFIAFITIWNFSYQQGLEEAYIPVEDSSSDYYLPSEAGVFERSEYATEYANMPVDENHQRLLKDYYKNRAYHGAPPSIPHPVEEMNLGDNTCLQCHQNGGFVNKYKAYAPVTPHPEMINCRQCHVAQNSNTLFKATNMAQVNAPKVGVNNALIGTPPMIPHQIQMRENCLSCHAGPAAPKEIRVTHPERVNCRQCHVPTDRVVSEITPFSRTKIDSNE